LPYSGGTTDLRSQREKVIRQKEGINESFFERKGGLPKVHQLSRDEQNENAQNSKNGFVHYLTAAEKGARKKSAAEMTKGERIKKTFLEEHSARPRLQAGGLRGGCCRCQISRL